VLVSAFGSWVPSYWSDEAATVRAVSLSPAGLLAFVQHRDAVHAVYDLAILGWARVAGTSELALRAPSAVAVGATAWMLVVLLRRHGLASTGVVAALLFAVLPRTTLIGSEARSTALTTALVTAVVLLADDVVRRDRRRTVVAFGVLAAATTAVFVDAALAVLAALVAVAVLVVVREARPPTFLRLTVAGVVGVAVAAPVVLAASGQREQIAWLGTQPSVNPWTVLAEPWAESSAGVAVLGGVALVVGLVLVRRVVAVAGVRLVVLVAAWMLVPGALLVGADAVAGPLYTSRYLAFCLPAVAVGIALVVTTVARAVRRSRWVPVVAVLLVAVVAAPTWVLQRTPTGKNGADLRQLAEVVAHRAQPGDAVVFVPGRTRALDPRQSLAAYPDAYRGLVDVALAQAFPATGTFSDRTAPLAEHPDRLRGIDRVWWLAPAARGCTAGADARTLTTLGFTAAEVARPGRDVVCRWSR
jgi:mannosyltransferase